MSLTARKEVPVEWGDCDPAEIVFYPNYFRWFDAGAHHLFRVAGCDWPALFSEHGVVGVPLLHADAKFVKPCRYGETIVVESRIVEWHRKVFKLSHRVFNGGEVAVEGHETRGWVLRDADGRMRTAPIPERVRALFEVRVG